MKYLLCILLFVTCASIAQVKDISKSSDITFKIKNGGFQVDGKFDETSVLINPNSADFLKSEFRVIINVKSLNTGISSRDNHLRGKDYFHADQFPKITFTSTQITKSAALNGFVITGKLQIKGISKEISFPFSKSQSADFDVFESTLKLNRLDYGIGEKSWLMSDIVNIRIKLLLTSKNL